MLDLFIEGFLIGLDWLFKIGVIVLMAITAFTPVALVLIEMISGWWMLSYLLIVPTLVGVHNMVF